MKERREGNVAEKKVRGKKQHGRRKTHCMIRNIILEKVQIRTSCPPVSPLPPVKA
jgi:hypothetical protein